MNIKRIDIVPLIFAAVLCVACGEDKKSAAPVDTVPVVEVISVRSMQPSLEVVLPGELKPWNKTQIFSKVKGYLGSVQADRGTSVRKGQVLATLEAPELIASLNHSKAQVSSAEASLLERQSKQKASKRTYQRVLQTSNTKGAVSANELEGTYATMMSDSALVKASQENLKAAKAQMEAQNQLAEYLTVRAPFDGTIIERNVSPGDLVGPETNVKPMFVLEDGSKLRLTIAIPENLSNSVGEKSTVSFTTQAEPLKKYSATFARSANSVQENNRTMMAEFDFVNANGDLKAGMYAEVKIPVKRSKSSLFVPKTSLLHSTEGVFVVKVTDNLAQWISIQKGNSLDSLVEVFGPVNEGDKVVKTAHDELRNGQPLKIKS
jgi:membrane fusion protein, multidrug efflux system